MYSSNKMDIAKTLRFKTITEPTSILALVIDIEVAKIITSFLKVLGKYLNNSSFCYSFNT